jgi:hypothetical protein
MKIADCVAALLANAAWRQRFGNAGRRRVGRQFSMSKMVDSNLIILSSD